ncbi:unnamed protein product [Toxocara canis]|uniref:Protein kinase domain-containing protein n=1 Tax=Toxocara canis TaxID=6265 RepID=A0A183UIP1_TOXCA|nr:unnamed protein product [Toxocara canis]
MASGIANFCFAVFIWAAGAECRHDCGDGKRGSCEPTLGDFTSTDQPRNVGFLKTNFFSTIAFSWWAIQVSEPSWRLLKSGMPGMQILERSIERRCMSAGSRGLYGFSFTNVTTDRAYMDFDLDNATVTDNDLQEIVVDVFYFCCLPQRGCGEFPSSDEEEDILLHLANKTASIVLRTPGIHAKPNSSSISGRYSDEQVPFHVAYVFLADANAEVKVFSGPLMFSQFDQTDQRSERRTNSIADLVRQGNFCSNDGQNDGEGLADGECIKYLSIKEYFLYCCCYENVSQCAYTADQEKFSYAQRNARNWRLNPNLRGFSKSSHSGDMHFVKHTARDVTFGWTYRDFIYSKPLNGTARHGSLSSEFNIPLWHCAHGLVQVNTSNGEPIGTKETRIMRSQACVTRHGSPDAKTILIDVSRRKFFGVVFKLEMVVVRISNIRNIKMTRSALTAWWMVVSVESVIQLGRGCITSTYAVHVDRVTEGGDDRRIVCYRFFDFETCKERIILLGETHYLPEREREELLPIRMSSGPPTGYILAVIIMQTISQLRLSEPTLDALNAGEPERTKPFNKVRHSCRYLQTYPKNKVTDGKAHMERIVQFMVCSCEMPLLQTHEGSDICEDSFAKNQTALAKSSEEVPRPMCYVGLVNAYKDLVPALLISASVESYQENNTIIKRVSRKLSKKRDPLLYADLIFSIFRALFGLPSWTLVKDAVPVGKRYSAPLNFCSRRLGCIDTIPERILNDSSLFAVLDCSSQLYADEEDSCHGIVDTSHMTARMGVLCCCRTKCPNVVGSGTNVGTVFNPFAHDHLF